MGDLKALSCPTCRWRSSRYGIVRDKSAGMADNVTKETAGAACSPQERVYRGRRIAAAKTRCGVNRNVIAGDAAVSRIKTGARHAAR